MDFARFSDDASFDMNSFSTPHTSNGLEAMLMARLQTRAAVLEMELRYAEKEKQNAHLANQALLQLLVRQSNNANVAQAKRLPSNSVAERKRLQELKQECRRLRMQCSRLRRPMINAKSSQTKDVMTLHKPVTNHAACSTNRSTPTVSSSETLVASIPALTKDKDDFDVEIKEEDFVEIASTSKQEHDDLDDMDDADLYAPWKFTRHDDASTSKPQFVERFSDLQTEAKVEDLSDEIATLTKTDSTKLKGLGLSIPSQAEVKSETEALRAVMEVEVVAKQHEFTVSVPISDNRVLSETAGETGMVRHLEEDYPTQHYRMVSITNLSNDVTPSDILSKIAGGAVVSLALIKPALAGMPTTAHVNFVYHASAVNYAKYYQDQPLVINGQKAKATHALVSIVPAVINRVLKDSCTRCLKTSPVPSTMTAGDLRRELLMLDQCIESNIESIQLKDDGCIHLSFLNIETAIRVKEYLDKSFKYKNYNIHYDHDPCARRLQQVSHVQNAVQTPQPQLNALASGSYLRKPQIMNTTSRSPILMRKPGYHSYEDRDDTRATQVTSLDYDDEVVDSGVDTEMSTMKIRGEPVTSAVHKSLSVLDMDYNEGDEVVYMASLQGEVAGTTDKVNVAVTIDPATAGHQDEVAQSDGVDMSADPVSSVNQEKEHSLDMMVLEQSIVKTAGERHSSSTEQTASTSSTTPVPSFIDTFSPEPRSYAKPLSVPGRKDTLFDGNLAEVPTPCNQLLHNTLQPAGQRPIPAGIIELAKALLSVSEIPASSSAQAKCSESSEADDATSLRSSPGRDASVSTSSDSQQIDFQRSASPSPSPHLVTSSTIASTSALSVAPRAALLHDSKYSPFAATSVPGRNSSPTPLQQNYRRHPSPPPFGFTFTPPVKSVQSKSRTGAVEAGVNPRGRKMVRYDDLYDTLPSTTKKKK